MPLSVPDWEADRVEVEQREGNPLKVVEVEGQGEMDTVCVGVLIGVREGGREPVIEGLLDTLGEEVTEVVRVGKIEGVD